MFASSYSQSGQFTNYFLEEVSLNNNVSFSRVDFPVLITIGSAANNSSAAFVVSRMMVIYTYSASTFSPIIGISQSDTLTWASNTLGYSNITGSRVFSFGLATSLSPGQYYVGWYLSSSTGFSSAGGNTTAFGGTRGHLYCPVGNLGYTVYEDFNVATASSHNIMLSNAMLSSYVTNTSQTLQVSQLTFAYLGVSSNPWYAAVPLQFRNY